MLDLEARITGRTAWLKGKDNDGVTRYARADELTITSFAKTVLGNFYAHVETIVGFGFRQSPNEPWSVFDTVDMAERHSARFGRIARSATAKSASA